MDELKVKVDQFKEWISEKKGEDIVVLDVRGKSSFTDWFIVCSGNGEIHTKAIAEHLIEKARQEKIYLMGSEGMSNAKWILLDFVDVIVHIFDIPVRDFYQLEDLWRKKPIRNNS